MQINLTRLVFILVSLALAWCVEAHHSAALLYDTSKEIEIQGVVTRYELGNPHMRIYFDVDNQGRTEKWMAEGGSRTVLLRKGWTGKEVSPGDIVTIRGNPSRDGSHIIHVNNLKLPDGRELYAEDIDTRQLERRRRQRE